MELLPLRLEQGLPSEGPRGAIPGAEQFEGEL